MALEQIISSYASRRRDGAPAADAAARAPPNTVVRRGADAASARGAPAGGLDAAAGEGDGDVQQMCASIRLAPHSKDSSGVAVTARSKRTQPTGTHQAGRWRCALRRL